MSIAHLLEDFTSFASGAVIPLTDVSLEEQRLEAFEKGYKAGWEDSLKAQSEDTQRVSTDLAQNLQELSFTYQEAYAAISRSLSPLLRQMVDIVLPKAAQATLGTRLMDMLEDFAAEYGKQPVEIMTAPVNVATIENMLLEDLPLPISVAADQSLEEGQVHIRVGQTEREIDLSEVLAEIDRAVTGYFEENQKETA